MKENKLIGKLTAIWTVTTVIVALLYFAQELLPIVVKNNKYMDMVMVKQYTLVPLIFCIVIFSVFGLASTFEKEKMQQGINIIAKKKSNRIIALSLSFLLCVSFILIGFASVASGVIESKNTKSLKGTVENVASQSDDKNGKVYTLITVKDDKGKTYHFDKSSHLKDLKVNQKDTVKLDYVKTSDPYNKVLDGKVLGYTTYIDENKK